MTIQSQIRKVFQGTATRQQMFSLFDRHSRRPQRWKDDAVAIRQPPVWHHCGDEPVQACIRRYLRGLCRF
ncbi:DUF1419 domain-containing protein [Ensifer sp. SSB1]|uniref:DUF1419 domain-containing protein n=1 Tax=Ensifer sp. SSB1 TaxID=2795385 RepID=UPI001A43DCB5|nr:DUF1419 domain-containing protein [Ensifer sp. SSB1]